MKICRISYALPPVLGGLEQHVAELSLRQANNGAELHLIFAQGEPLIHARVHCHRVPVVPRREGERSTRLKLRFMLRAWPTLWRLARREHFDVIDAHGDFVEGFFIGLLGRLTNTPNVLTLHGGLNRRAAARWASRSSFAFVTHVVAVSDYIADQVRQRGVPSSKTSVISGGVDISCFSAVAAVKSRPPTVLYVGRLQPVKGVAVLLQTAPLVLEKIPQAQFVIVGSGPDERKLKSSASGVRNIQFVGEVPREQVARFLSAADLLVQPSVELRGQSEGQSRTVMEAMAAGLPVVASRTGGIPELIVDGKGGRLVPPGDTWALAKALVEVLCNPGAAREMGCFNRAAVAPRDFCCIEKQVTALFERLKAARTK